MKVWSLENAAVTAAAASFITLAWYVVIVAIGSAMTLTFAWQLKPLTRGLLIAIYCFAYFMMFPVTTRRMPGKC